MTGVEQKVQAAEAALQGAERDNKTRDLIGRIASIRATLAVTQHQVEAIITQSRRALEYLHPDNLPERLPITWKMGDAYRSPGRPCRSPPGLYRSHVYLRSDLGDTVIAMMAAIGLGNIQVTENQLYLAFETYRQVLQLVGDSPLPNALGAYLGLARIYYEWNDLDAAEQHANRASNWRGSMTSLLQIRSSLRCFLPA